MVRELAGLSPWELEALGCHNPLSSGRLSHWFDFLWEKSAGVPGDVAEFGVFQGASLIPTALILRQVAPEKTLYGFDTFEGFPEIQSPQDHPSKFEEMYSSGQISSRHFTMVQRQRTISDFWGRPHYGSNAISTSGNFSRTSIDLVQEKLDFFGLQNVHLVQGPIEDTLGSAPLKSISGVLLDCDLYSGYAEVLSTIAGKVSKGGVIHLDEYFSLKFPGPRLAVDEFLAVNADFRIDEFVDVSNGFMRNQLVKQ